MTSKPLAIVAGSGSGLGHALLRCFENKGMKAVGLSRSPSDIDGLDIRGCDLTDHDMVSSTVAPLVTEFGAPEIVVHNPAHLVIGSFLDTPLEEIEACWHNMVFSAATLAHCTMQPMVAAGGGTFIVSGATASLRGGGKFAAFASAKFALRGLTQSLAREFQPGGIHVIHTILDGIIDTPKSRELHSLSPSKMMKVDDLAEAYFQLSQQPQSVWTHELDLRPQSEAF